MDKTDIQLFLSIVHNSSITRAAEQMHFNQSTVSYRLKSMEKELGVPLFHRKKGVRTSELTRYGELFIPLAKQWWVLYQDTLDLAHYPDNLLTVGAISSISSPILSEVYTAVSHSETPLRLRVITGYSEEVYRLVETYEADIGFVGEPSERKNVQTIPLFTQNYYVVRYAKYPTVMRRLTPDSLSPKQEIYVSWGSEYDRWHESQWGRHELYHACVDTVSLLEDFLTEEDYWAIVPGSLIRCFRKNTNIQIDQLELVDPPMRKCYMLRQREPKPSRADSILYFERTLDAVLGKIPDIERL